MPSPRPQKPSLSVVVALTLTRPSSMPRISAIRAAMAENDVQKMLDLVTEDMIDALVLAGTPDEVRGNQDVIDAYLGVPHD